MQKNNFPLVAVCIPTANLGKASLFLLQHCLQSIKFQDYSNVIVVISDHSADWEIHDYLYENNLIGPDVEDPELEVVYTRLEEGRGMGVINHNNAWDFAIKHQAEFIKPLHQDDYLATPVALSRMVDMLQSSQAMWVACGCNHVDDDGNDLNYTHPPRWVSDFRMAYGLNHIGSVNTIMIRPTPMRQDTNLLFLNDCEFYYRMGQEYGPPALINDVLVTVRIRADGVSNKLDLDVVKAKDQRYVQIKHGVTE